jgi:shikimate dehydrogenase
MYLGVIGHPLRQSLSPAFQQAALDHLGIEARYEAWPTPAEGLEARVNGLRAPSVLGANVTIPYKETVMPMMDELDRLVQRVGAVNTIVNRDGRLLGYNTDVAGFLRGLIETVDFDPNGKRCLVAGAGGAARAVVVGLIDAKAAKITVINRTFTRAAHLAGELRPSSGDTTLSALPDSAPSWNAASSGCDVLINCTSAGSAGSSAETESPVPVDIIRSGMLVYDLIYRPAETVLMREARLRGARVLGGLPMLVFQGAESFEIWTGKKAPVDVMFEAAEKALAGGAA